MNKGLCLKIKKRNLALNKPFDRAMCYACKFQEKCLEYGEYIHGHSDILREESQTKEE